jgi:hypothetical protein
MNEKNSFIPNDFQPIDMYSVDKLSMAWGGQHLFPEPSIGRNGHYSDINSIGRKRVERERSD